MNTGRYLQRIDFDGPIQQDEETLHALVQAHLYSVPFENLDVHLGVPITLDLDAVQRKIVDRRRGGFCYEVNGLFGWLLRELGFRVDYLSARASRWGGFDAPFSHMVLRVWIDDTAYLVDVGYGEAMRAPMAMTPGEKQEAFGCTYGLEAHASDLRFVTCDAYGMERGYLIDARPRRLEEFAAMCRHHQTSMESLFTRKRLCTMPTPTGRLTLSETRLIINENGFRTTQEIASEATYLATLRRYFGIEIPYMPRNRSNRLSARISKQALRWQHRARRAWSLIAEQPVLHEFH